MEKVYHQTVKKVTDDFEGLRFNTAISQMMVFINEGYKVDSIPKEYAEGFVKLLSPIAPHLAEELWEKLGHNETITYENWPQYDESKMIDDVIEVVVQVNGKVKTKLAIAKDSSKEELEIAALADDHIQKATEGKQIRKVIVIPGKLVNIVVS